MFNFSKANLVQGFRVRDPKEDVPGFRLAPDGPVGRSGMDFLSNERLDPDRSRWLSDYLLEANDRFARNPYFGGSLASQRGQSGQYLSEEGSERRNYPSQIWAGNDPDTAWAKCHARCVEQTVGRGLPDSFTAYRRCMRACLNSGGIFDY